MEYQLYTLANGIRLVHRSIHNHVAHCGIVVNTGSRDETQKEHGIAHFIEHVIFKGTQKRKAYHVISRLENVGAELNAYTAKEETFVYAAFLNRYYDRVLELLSDITFNSVFPEKELAKEKDVILDEINSYKDSPSELIFDDFEELLYEGHAIGRPILGTPRNVKRLSREDILQFVNRTYHTDQMVICSVGSLDFKKLIRMVEKYFGAIPERRRDYSRTPLGAYLPQSKILKKKTYQTHCILGTQAYPITDERRTTLALLNNLLGGPAMNSRLNLAVRERRGYTYNIESNYTAYSDTGLFGIYLGTDSSYYQKSLDVVGRELKQLRDQKIGVMQLKIAKQQFLGQLAIGYESNQNKLISDGKNLLLRNDITTLNKLATRIEGITASQLLEVANEILDPARMSRLTYLSK